jgi:hypothetical protein
MPNAFEFSPFAAHQQKEKEKLIDCAQFVPASLREHRE